MSSFYIQRSWRCGKYYSYDEHTRVPDIVIMNEGTKERLTAKQEQAIEAQKNRPLLKTVFKEAVEEERKKHKQNMALCSIK